MKRIATVFTFGLCTVSAKGAAEPRNPNLPAHHAKAALGIDGEHTETLCQKLVALADTDGDGHVSRSELVSFVRRYVKKQVAERFPRLDRNGDARVTPDEVPNMPVERFARFDTNRDRAFTASELEAVMHEQATERCRKVLAELDADEDGTLSSADVKAAQVLRVSKR
jgi:hypothetical protein